MILYNLSNWLGRENCHKEALKMADLGIRFCIRYGNLAFFPILVFNKGGALAELGKIDQAKKYLHQSVTIFEAMDRPDLIQVATDWCKLHYRIDIQ